MIGIDANILSLMLCPNSKAPVDPVSNQEIERVKERLDFLIADLDAQGETILIPLPALTEFLVLVGNAAPEYLAMIHKLPRFVIRDYTEKAAIELAAVIRKALDSRGNIDKELDSKRKRDFVEATWAKVNFDRQIVAIAKVEPVSKFYSTDRDVHVHAKLMGVPCFDLADMRLPPEKSQMELDYETLIKTDPNPES